MKKREKPISGVQLANTYFLPKAEASAVDWLSWALRLHRQSLITMTPGDWQNLRIELAQFVMGNDVALPGRGGITGRVGGLQDVDQPSEEEAKEILKTFGRVIQIALDQIRPPIPVPGEAFQVRPVPMGRYLVNEQLYWDHRPAGQGGQRFASHKEIQATRHESEWHVRGMYALGRLLERCGHLLRECQALRPHSVEPCKTRFLSLKGDGKYCSAGCKSRATTRAARIRAAAGQPKQKRGRPRKR